MDCTGGRISVHPRVIGIYNCFLLPTRLPAPHAVAAGHVVEINCQCADRVYLSARDSLGWTANDFQLPCNISQFFEIISA